MAAAVPGIQSLRSGPVLLLKALERLVVLRVDAQVLLDALLGTQAQEPAKGVGLGATQVAAHAVVVGITETPTLQARVNGDALPVPGL